MYIYSPNGGGTSLTPDWTCYPATSTNSFDRPFVEDAGDDASSDASDAAAADAGTDAATTPDAGPGTGEDAGTDSGTVLSTDYLLHLVDFSTLQAPVGATVDLFWGEGAPNNSNPTAAIAGQPVAETFMVAADAGGIIRYHPPPGLLTLSYYIHPSNDAGAYDQDPLYWYNLDVVPPGYDAGTAGNGQLESNSISVSTDVALITSVLGSQPIQSNLAALVTAARDCAGNDVTGAQLKLIDGVTGQDVIAGASGPAAPVAFYFLNNIPDTTCSYTNNSGGKAIWAIINAPVNEGAGIDAGAAHPYVLQMYGRMTSSDPATGTLISSVPVELYPGGNSVARVYKQYLPAPNSP
jgi:hypothetical protein